MAAHAVQSHAVVEARCVRLYSAYLLSIAKMSIEKQLFEAEVVVVLSLHNILGKPPKGGFWNGLRHR